MVLLIQVKTLRFNNLTNISGQALISILQFSSTICVPVQFLYYFVLIRTKANDC